MSTTALRIGLHPLVSEKSVKQQMSNKATFRVVAHATKQEIAAAVYEIYKVRARRIRTIAVSPKRRVRGRSVGFTRHWKKAYVTVDDIQALNVVP